MDVALGLDERLRPVAVMNVPIDDEHAPRAIPLPGVVSADSDIPKQTETHRRTAQRVMSRRSHGAEAAARSVAECQIDAVQHGTGAGCGGVPRSVAGDGVSL